MTWTTQITLWCDGCSKWERWETDLVTTAREEAERIGWETNRGGPDYCRDCSDDEGGDQ